MPLTAEQRALAARAKPQRPRESDARAAERAAAILDRLEKLHPDARCALEHRDAYQLVMATILSAQCTDERVNMVTPRLFARYPAAADLAAAEPAELEEIIRSTGFFRAKARSLIGCARALVERHGGRVPRTVAEMVALPGVGRKTANVVLGHAYGLAEGVAVDTHVLRVAARLGLTAGEDPLAVEARLMLLVPPERWTRTTDLVIFHGRRVCDARRPNCGGCPLFDLCAWDQRQAWALGRPPSKPARQPPGARPAGAATRRKSKG